MKIAHLTTGHEPFDTRVFHKQCKSLAAAGFDVTLVVPHDKDLMVDGVKIKAIDMPRNRFHRLISLSCQAYRKAIEIDADVYQLHDPDLIPAGLALKWRNKIVVFDSHEDFPADILAKSWIPRRIRKLVSCLYSSLEKFAFSRFDAVLSVHEQIQSRIVAYQPNTFVVKNFPVIDTSFQLSEERLQKFIWLGLLCPSRCSSQIDTAIKMLDNAVLDVIGTVLDFKPSTNNIKLLGSFPQKEAMQIAAKYLAGLVTYLPEPNHVDALPNKLFEYMSMGLPVIASNFPKWKTIVDDAGCGILVDPNSPQEIAQAMQWMLDNQAEAFEMGVRGRKAVLEKYSWHSEEQVLFNVYKGLRI